MNSKFGRKLGILVALVVVIGGAFGVYSYIQANKIPPEFQKAREEGTIISGRIVGNSAGLAGDLNNANELIKQKKFNEANKLIDELSEKNKNIRNDALELSKKLEEMTKSVEGVRSDEAKQEAITGINSDLSLITHLLTYSDLLQNLLVSMKASQTDRTQVQQIKALVEKINTEVQQINMFNAAAEDAFKKFDNLTK